LAFGTNPKKLQPVVYDLKSTGLSQVPGQASQVIPTEVNSLPAFNTQKDMLVSLASGRHAVAAVGLVNPLDQAEFFQLVDRAVNGHQTQPRMFFPSEVKNLHRAEDFGAIQDDLNDRTPRRGQTVSTILQLGQPGWRQSWERHRLRPF
jgi:hypothetical protein